MDLLLSKSISWSISLIDASVHGTPADYRMAYGTICVKL